MEQCDIYNGCAWAEDFAYTMLRTLTLMPSLQEWREFICVYSPVHDKTVDSIILIPVEIPSAMGVVPRERENMVIRQFGALKEASGLICCLLADSS